jgi:hypothetical protein
MSRVDKAGFRDVKATKEENGENITEISSGIKKGYELAKVQSIYEIP